MSEKATVRRLVVCVDGVTESTSSTGSSKKSRKANPSSIARLRAVIKSGVCTDSKGRTIQQTVKYHQAVNPSPLAARFSSRTATTFEQQIQDIVLDICRSLEDPQDEIYLFGSGYGGSSVRAVAGVLHHMGAPRPGALSDLPQMYQRAVDLYKARQTDDSITGGRALQFLRSRTQGLANIQLVGVLDSLKAPTGKQLFDTSFNPSIRNFRQALAFNENRPHTNPDVASNPTTKDLEGRSFVQAWFIGGHQDIIGGTVQDGLSLYPLQWLLIESMLLGLVVARASGSENPISLVFPQFTGAVPDLHVADKVKWELEYTNKIQISMFDLQSQHTAAQSAEDPSHEIAFDGSGSLYKAPRKVFDPDGLMGFDRANASGVIIHPSVFCILDRSQRFLEHGRFKPYKDQLADFEMNFMRGGHGADPPWLQGSELLTSGVKAFRILVCGKTGVGKSTLINKVFGVEMTEESNTYKQGDHDINTAFESPNHPGLLIHDSRGWQAGSDLELDLIAQFLRYRAFQKDPAEALHVIWFCVDADVSRIEEADKRTFETIAQYSNHVPVFVVGTKKDKLMALRKGELLHDYMLKTNDYYESNQLANLEADKMAHETFGALRDQLSQIKSYKADGYVLISKNDDKGVKDLVTQTLDMITDERVRLFCVAAQVVDVEHKIDSAITECMRLGTHAVRTAMVPLPFSSVIGTPTVSRILCEHVLQCFGFPKAMPEAVEEIMSRIVMGNLKQFMAVTLTQFMAVSAVSVGVAVATAGVGAIIGLTGSFLSAPPTARMLIKCACDMILILERSFRYNGKYVSVKQIEDAAKQYVAMRTTSFGGKDKRLQEDVHEQVDHLIPLARVQVGWKFKGIRSGFEHIIYKNRFDRPPEDEVPDPFADKMAELDSINNQRVELLGDVQRPTELSGTPSCAEMPDTSPAPAPSVAELPGSEATASGTQSRPSDTSFSSNASTLAVPSSRSVSSPSIPELSAAPTLREPDRKTLERGQSESSGSSGNIFRKGWKSMKMRKTKATTT